jgi:PAS domain S-box-containing protein
MMSDPAAGTLYAARRLMWVLVVPVLALLAVLSTLQYRQRLDEAERDLLRRAEERAQELESIARPAMAHVHDLRRMLEERWQNPPDSGATLRQALAARDDGGPRDGWTLDGAPLALRERLGQVWWAPADGHEPEPLWLRRAQAFVEAARIVQQRAPGFQAAWFSAADTNTRFGYPWVATDRMLQANGQPSLRAVDALRLAETQRAERALAGDPNDISSWSLPSVSPLDGELVMAHSARVVEGSRYRGEVRLEFRLEALQRSARRWQEAWQDGGGREATHVWVVDRGLNLLADATQPLPAPSGPGLAATVLRVPLATRLPPGLGRADLDATLFTLDRVHRAGDGSWVLAAAVRIGSPWVYVQAVPASALRAVVLPTLIPNALLGLALLATFVAGQVLVARWFVAPALQVLAYLRRLSTEPDAPAPALDGRWRGWVDAVTETFRAHRELQRRERYHEAFKSAMVDHAPTAIVTTSGLGHIVDFNPAAERVFGQARAAVIGRVLGEVLIPERHRPAHRAEMQRLRAGEPVSGFGKPFEMTGLRADGSEFPMEMLAFHITLEGENFYTGFITDLSARQEQARQIERQRDALRQTEKLSAMGTLLAGVAHELNNPLAIVMGRASLLEEKAPEGDLAADARRIREAAERCGRIVRTFLNMARHKPAERSAVRLSDIVRAAADMLGYTLRSHGITLELALDEQLPEVQADGDQIGQVVLNLIVNAQQALASAQGPRRIIIATGSAPADPAARHPEPRVWLRVADSGPGVPEDAAGRIFEPFFTTKAVGLGTGLGLAVSRTIVREHGGELVLEPGGQGAAFLLTLPVSGEPAPTSAPLPLAPPPGEAHARVLVVDDEPEIADLIRAVLEGAGFEVLTAESGAVALEMLAELRPDAIVSDVRMPDLDGAGLWRAVRQLWPALAQRMVFVTGDTLSPQARQLLDESGCAGVDKPFSNADLLAAVHAALER